METPSLERFIGEISTDIKWIKEALEKSDKKYAPFWIKYPVYAVSAGMLSWTFNQLLDLIPKVKAIF